MTRPVPVGVVLSLMLAAGLAAAEEWGVPDPQYFAGRYERVGRDSNAPRGLIDDVVRIDVEAGGLVLRDCGGGEVVLTRDRSFETQNFLTGRDGPVRLWCQFFNDSENYPVLACASEAGARFTLWPMADGSADTPLECGT
jgi:hypothetical protein